MGFKNTSTPHFQLLHTFKLYIPHVTKFVRLLFSPELLGTEGTNEKVIDLHLTI